jgi:hypothetical protein
MVIIMGLGDFMSVVLDSVKNVPSATKGAGEGLGSFFHGLDGMIRKT